MDKDVRTRLEHNRDQIDELLNQEELQYIGTFYGERGKYELYLFPKSTEKYCDWSNAKQYCENMGGSLPNIGELQYIHDKGLGQEFKDNIFWSSTEHSSAKAFSYYFIHSNKRSNKKIANAYVRAVKRCYI